MSELDDAPGAPPDQSAWPDRNITVRSLSRPDSVKEEGSDLFAPERAAPLPETSDAVVGTRSDGNAAPSSSGGGTFWFDPTSEVRVIPVDHDPFRDAPFQWSTVNPHITSSQPAAENGADHSQASRQWSPTGESEISIKPSSVEPQKVLIDNAFKSDASWGERARSRLALATARPGFGYIDDDPEGTAGEVAESIARDPHADPFNAPPAGAASIPQAWQSMGVVSPSALDKIIYEDPDRPVAGGMVGRAADQAGQFLRNLALGAVKVGADVVGGGGEAIDWGMHKLGAPEPPQDSPFKSYYPGAAFRQLREWSGYPVETAVKQAIEAPYDPDFANWQTNPAAFDRAVQKSLNLAGNVGSGSFARMAAVPVEGGTLGTFGGRIAARNLPKVQAALKEAKKLVKLGANNNDLWILTGWRRGKEGLWEFEIPDNGLTVKGYDQAKHNLFNGNRLLDLISHPQLEKAYGRRALNRIGVFFDRKLRDRLRDGEDVAGYSFDVGIPIIALRPTADHVDLGLSPGTPVLDPYQTKVLLHELNHVISAMEGRSPGGDFRRIINLVRGPLAKEGYTQPQIWYAATNYYQLLADEVRSRVVMARYGLPLETLAAEPPSQTALARLSSVGWDRESRQIVPAPPSRARSKARRREEDAKNIIDRMRAVGLLSAPFFKNLGGKKSKFKSLE